MRNIRVAIAGVGNCASSLVQGLEYYKGRNEAAYSGVMHARIGDWAPSDNPAKLNDLASSLVRSAINEAWPCSE